MKDEEIKKRLLEKLDLSPIAANTMYSIYIDVCVEVAKEYAQSQLQEELIKYDIWLFKMTSRRSVDSVSEYLTLKN